METSAYHLILLTLNFNKLRYFSYDPPIEVRPGDELRTTCEYNSVGRKAVTYYGDSVNDEMCFTNLAFYSKTNSISSDLFCEQWETLDFCRLSNGPKNQKIINGCDWSAYQDVSNTYTKARMQKVTNACRLGQCNDECGIALDEAWASKCLQGVIGDYMLEQFFLKPEWRAFYQALITCD